MRLIRELVKRRLLSRDIALTQPAGQFTLVEHKLKKIRDRGLRIERVIDGGAHLGGWLQFVKNVYPSAAVLCVEPRDASLPDLRKAAERLGNVLICSKLLGPTVGEVDFNEADDNSSCLPNSRGERFGTQTRRQMTTLDLLVEEFKFSWPDLIKLDLQGYELEALQGGTQCIRHVQALLLEVSLIPLQKGTPLATEVFAYVDQHGFRLYDILGLWHRPLDGALAQGDFLFLKKDHPLLADSRWSEAFA